MQTTARILSVEDDPKEAALAEAEVCRADILCTFRQVDTREGVVEALGAFVPDVILTDHALPSLPARNFQVALYDAVNDLLSVPYVVDEYDTDFPSWKPGKGLTEHVLRTGQSLLVNRRRD